MFKDIPRRHPRLPYDKVTSTKYGMSRTTAVSMLKDRFGSNADMIVVIPGIRKAVLLGKDGKPFRVLGMGSTVEEMLEDAMENKSHYEPTDEGEPD